MWTVLLHPEVEAWRELQAAKTQLAFNQSLYLLQQFGPNLGRPLVDSVKGSQLHNLKELRPPAAGKSVVRALFVFDPRRQAILLVAGDKSENWHAWYKSNIAIAESRYKEYLNEN